MASGASGEADTNGKEHKPSEATIDDAVRSANRRMEHTRCEYSYHKETNRVSIKVINEDTDEVIREDVYKRQRIPRLSRTAKTPSISWLTVLLTRQHMMPIISSFRKMWKFTMIR